MARPSSGRRTNHVENLERREQAKSTMANVSKLLERNALRLTRKRTSSGDGPGLQNRRAAGSPVADGFDPHSLPPFQTCRITGDSRFRSFRTHRLRSISDFLMVTSVRLIGFAGNQFCRFALVFGPIILTNGKRTTAIFPGFHSSGRRGCGHPTRGRARSQMPSRAVRGEGQALLR